MTTTATVEVARVCPGCGGTGGVPAPGRGGTTAARAAGWQVATAVRILDNPPAGITPARLDALRLRVEHPDLSVLEIARRHRSGLRPETFRRRLLRALESVDVTG